jgi:ribosomal protein S18 acetylase RimI-like enzyme
MLQATQALTPITTSARLRSYTTSDLPAVVRMLGPVLARFYPEGDAWLARRLGDVSHGRAGCIVATVGQEIVGAVIVTPKTATKVKISTLYVDPSARGNGIGERLLEQALAELSKESPKQIYITVPHVMTGSLEPTLKTNGFSWSTQVQNRYGPGRHEDIYELWLEPN